MKPMFAALCLVAAALVVPAEASVPVVVVQETRTPAASKNKHGVPQGVQHVVLLKNVSAYPVRGLRVAYGGKVAVDGWTRSSGLTAATLAAACATAGVARLLVTSTARDGSLAGPDAELLAEVLEAGLPVIAAGGISSIDDLVRVRALGCEAAVAGSALLAGRFTLAEARARL